MAQFDPSQWEPVDTGVPPNIRFENISDEDRQRVLSQLGTLPVDLGQPKSAKQFDPAKWEPVNIAPTATAPITPGAPPAPPGYQKRAQTFQQATKRGLPIPDPKEVLFPGAQADDSLWGRFKSGQLSEGLPGDILQSGFNAMGWLGGAPEKTAQAIPPLFQVQQNAIPVQRRLEATGLSPTDARNAAQIITGARAAGGAMFAPIEGFLPRGPVEAFGQAAAAAGQGLASAARKLGLPEPVTGLIEEFTPDAVMLGMPLLAHRMMNPPVPKAIPKPLPGARPFGAEPAFVEGLPKPPEPPRPPPRKQLPSPAQQAEQTKGAEFRPPEPPPGPSVSGGEPTASPKRPPAPESSEAHVDSNGKVFKPGPDLNDTEVLYQQSVDKLSLGREKGGWDPQDIQALSSPESGIAGVRTAKEDIFGLTHGDAIKRAAEKYPGENITPENYLYRVKTPAGEGMLTLKQLDTIQNPKLLKEKLAHKAANDQTSANFPPPPSEALPKSAPQMRSQIAQPSKPPPVAPESSIKAPPVQEALIAAPPPEVLAAPKGARTPVKSRAVADEKLDLPSFVAREGGIQAREFPGNVKGLRQNGAKQPGLFNNKGTTWEEMAQKVRDAGYDIKAPTSDALHEALLNHYTGKKVQGAANIDAGIKQEFKKQDQGAVFDVIKNFKRDTDDVDHLVSLLQSESPAVRMAAKNKLEQLYPEVVEKPAVVTDHEPAAPPPKQKLSPDELAEQAAWRSGEMGVVPKPPKFEKTPAGEQGVIGDLPQRKVSETATKGKRKQKEKPTPLEQAGYAAEDADNQYVLKDTNTVYTKAEKELLQRAKFGPRGGVTLTDPPYISGKELRHLPQKWAKAVTTDLPVDATGGDPAWLTRKKVAFNAASGAEKLLPNSLVYRGIKSGEKMLELIDEHPDKVRGIRNFMLETGDEAFEPIKNIDVYKLLDTEEARAYAEDNGILTVPAGYPRPVQPDMVKVAEVKRLFESLTDEEKSQYREGRKFLDNYVTKAMEMDPNTSYSGYFPHMRETIETGKTFTIKVGEGRIPKTLADSIPTKIKASIEKHRTSDAPADFYNLDAIHALINHVSRRIALSGGIDPRFGTKVTGMLERINPVLEALAKEEPALIPHAKRMMERVLGHADRPESPATDLLLQSQALRTMGVRVMPVIKNHIQKMNTFADVGPVAFFRGFKDMYNPERRAIAKAAGVDFSEGALLQDINMVKEGDTWIQRRSGDVRNINNKALWGMKWSEKSNQVHAFLSALRKGEEIFGEATPEAIRYARMSQSRTQFGRPSSMIEAGQTSNAGRLAFQLKRFSLANYDFLQDLAKHPTKAARYLGASMFLFGADGFFPGLDDEVRDHVWDKWPGGIFSALGYAVADDVSIFPSDAVRSIGFFLPGPALANFLDATSAITGKSMNPFEKMDIGTELTPEQRMAKSVRSIPAGGVMLNAFRKMFVDLRSVNNNDGDVLQPADWTEAIGYNVPSGARAEDRTKPEIVMQGLGAQPKARQDEFKHQRELGDIRQEEIRIKQKAADAYVTAEMENERGNAARSSEWFEKSHQMIEDFNDKHEGANIKLSSDLVKEARKRRRFTPSERQLQSLPKDLRGIEEARPLEE